MPRHHIRLAVLFLSAVAAGTDASAQQHPGEQHIDLSRYYFASPQAEREARTKLRDQLAKFDAYKPVLMHDSHTLLSALTDYAALLSQATRHTMYLHLRCALDRGDAASCADEGKIDADVSAHTEFLGGAIRAASPAVVADFIAREPGLGVYRHQLASIERDREHALDASAESLLDRLHPSIAGWQYPLYQRTIAHIAFGTVKTARGEFDVLSQHALIAADPDRAAREQRFHKLWAGYASARDLLAFALLRTAQAGNALARAHHFANAPDAHYFELWLEPERVRKLIGTVATHGDLLRRFQRIRAADVRRLYAIDNAQIWDVDLPPAQAPHYSLAAARRTLHDAFAALGGTYQAAFDALLDPRNGRFDVMPGGPRRPHDRAGGGFSLGFPGTSAVLFVGAFDGTYRQLSIIAHEGGHAAHRDLMNRHGVLPVYASGPSWLFESFAEFNELLLADQLARHSSDRELRRFFHEQFLAIKGLDFLYGAQDAALEQAIYDGVLAGSLHDADDLDRLARASDTRFSPWTKKYPELKQRWAALSLAYEDPLYYVNYLYASLLALNYYERWRHAPERFARAYVALLEHGFDESPRRLLADRLGLDLGDDRALVETAVAVVDRTLDELEKDGRTIPEDARRRHNRVRERDPARPLPESLSHLARSPRDRG